MGQNNSWNSSSLGFLSVRTSLSVGRRKHDKVGKGSLSWLYGMCCRSEMQKWCLLTCWVQTVWQEVKVNVWITVFFFSFLDFSHSLRFFWLLFTSSDVVLFWSPKSSLNIQWEAECWSPFTVGWFCHQLVSGGRQIDIFSSQQKLWYNWDAPMTQKETERCFKASEFERGAGFGLFTVRNVWRKLCSLCLRD